MAASAPRPATPREESHYLPMAEMQGITKRFPGTIANDKVDLNVAQGSVHAVLGENGAGKSTLMNVLSGRYRPDEGEIRIEGQVRQFSAPRDAIRAGVGMVHQHFMLVETLTVAENVVLGDTSIGYRVQPAALRARVAALSAEAGLELDPDAYIWQLSVGEQQRVEIVKMLYRGARLLILDEPTAVLTPQERAQLFAHIRLMAEAGRTILFISHKLEEVLAAADWITVMRGGRVVDHVRPQDTRQEELVRMMVGRPVLFDFKRPQVALGAPRLILEHARALNDRGAEAVRDVSLAVRAGEILGIAGVAGNGQRELAETLTGLRPLTRGRIQVDQRELTNAAPRRFIDAGVAYVPQDRRRTGTAPNLSLIQNLALKSYRTDLPGYLISHARQARQADAWLARFAVTASSSRVPARILSGGNLQKLILARELSGPRRVLIAESPTRGLDIGAIESVQETLLQQKEAEVAILLLSEDLDEILTLSDCVAVMFEGRLSDVMDAAQADADRIGHMMAGSSLQDAAA